MAEVLESQGATSLDIEVPPTLDGALDRAWLTEALEPVGKGARVTASKRVEVIRTVATKVRFTVTFEGRAEPAHFCLKGFLDVDEATARGGSTCIREADFYTSSRRASTCACPLASQRSSIARRSRASIIMRDLIADGARFCSALEPFTADDAAASLEQIARLHAGRPLLDSERWITPRIGDLALAQHAPIPLLQEMLDGPRGRGPSPAAMLNAERLVAGMKVLAQRDEARPQYLVHGDAHAGNIYRTADGHGTDRLAAAAIRTVSVANSYSWSSIGSGSAVLVFPEAGSRNPSLQTSPTYRPSGIAAIAARIAPSDLA